MLAGLLDHRSDRDAQQGTAAQLSPVVDMELQVTGPFAEGVLSLTGEPSDAAQQHACSFSLCRPSVELPTLSNLLPVQAELILKAMPWQKSASWVLQSPSLP